MNLVETVLRSELLVFFLSAMRLSGAIMVAPLAWMSAPLRVRVALVLLLSAAVHGVVASAPLPQETLGLGLVLAGELLVGVLMGLVVRGVIAIAEIAGDTVAPLFGFGAAQLFDPHTHSNQTVITTVFRQLIVFLAMVVGVHRVLLAGVFGSFKVVPLGDTARSMLAVPSIMDLATRVVDGGVRIALPLLAILFMTQIALAFVSRAAPAMQIFSVGFAVTLAVGGLTLMVILPDMARAMIVELSRVEGQVEAVVTLLGAPP